MKEPLKNDYENIVSVTNFFGMIELDFCCGYCKQYAEDKFTKIMGEKVWEAFNKQNNFFRNFGQTNWGTTKGWRWRTENGPFLDPDRGVPSG